MFKMSKPRSYFVPLGQFNYIIIYNHIHDTVVCYFKNSWPSRLYMRTAQQFYRERRAEQTAKRKNTTYSGFTSS